jgi:hypothetical protein
MKRLIPDTLRNGIGEVEHDAMPTRQQVRVSYLGERLPELHDNIPPRAVQLRQEGFQALRRHARCAGNSS